jgi:mRNA-degrading endonuclease RelE of RelBE toxin-antitoxin system
MLAGVEHPVHGRIYRLRVGKFRVLYCIAEREGRVYVLTFDLRDRVYDGL